MCLAVHIIYYNALGVVDSDMSGFIETNSGFSWAIFKHICQHTSTRLLQQH